MAEIAYFQNQHDWSTYSELPRTATAQALLPSLDSDSIIKAAAEISVRKSTAT